MNAVQGWGGGGVEVRVGVVMGWGWGWGADREKSSEENKTCSRKPVHGVWKTKHRSFAFPQTTVKRRREAIFFFSSVKVNK